MEYILTLALMWLPGVWTHYDMNHQETMKDCQDLANYVMAEMEQSTGEQRGVKWTLYCKAQAVL